MIKKYFIVLFLSLCFALSLEAKLNLSPLFIQISDALGAAKKGDNKAGEEKARCRDSRLQRGGEQLLFPHLS